MPFDGPHPFFATLQTAPFLVAVAFKNLRRLLLRLFFDCLAVIELSDPVCSSSKLYCVSPLIQFLPRPTQDLDLFWRKTIATVGSLRSNASLIEKTCSIPFHGNRRSSWRPLRRRPLLQPSGSRQHHAMVLDMINTRPIPLDTLQDLPASVLQGLLRRHLLQNARVL